MYNDLKRTCRADVLKALSGDVSRGLHKLPNCRRSVLFRKWNNRFFNLT